MNKSKTVKVEWKNIDWNTIQWNQIPWKVVEAKVFKLQKRIYKASLDGNVKKVRKLQRTLMSSWSNKLLAVRRVTQDNQGKRTAGVDGVKLIPEQKRFELAKGLKLSDKSRATRRVYIPKPGKSEKRPLGIPTMLDRAKQALVKNVMEPEWEAIMEPSSYGFRPGRCTQDAIQYIKLSLQHASKYVLDADISKCFDSIDHSALLQKTNIKSGKMRKQIKAWLKSGVIDRGVFEETTKGTPQGGVISPLLANIALHGLEEHLMEFARNSKGWKYKSGMPISRINRMNSLTICRYADDFVVLHNSKEVILEVKEIITEWLKSVGLELSLSKTRIAHTLSKEESEDGKAGFDFLSFHIQQYEAGIHKDAKNTHNLHLGFRTLITPSKKALEEHQRKIKAVVREHRNSSQTVLISELNPITRGWANYYRYSDVKSFGILSKLDHMLYGKLRSWGRKRCKGSIKKAHLKYWHHIGSRKWVFATVQGNNTLKLLNYSDVECSSTDYVMVKGKRSPYDGDWLYWVTRKGEYPEVSPSLGIILKKQKGKCAICEQYFQPDDLMERDHIVPTSLKGSNKYGNIQLLHRHCHDVKTANDRKTLANSKLLTKQLRDSIELRWLDGETEFSPEEEVILNEILNDRYEDNEANKAKFVNHLEKRKRKKKPKTREPVQYIKGRRIKTQLKQPIAQCRGS